MWPPLPGWPVRWSAPAIGSASFCQESLPGLVKQLSIRRLAPVAGPAEGSLVMAQQTVKMRLQGPVIGMTRPVFYAQARSWAKPSAHLGRRELVK